MNDGRRRFQEKTSGRIGGGRGSGIESSDDALSNTCTRSVVDDDGASDDGVRAIERNEGVEYGAVGVAMRIGADREKTTADLANFVLGASRAVGSTSRVAKTRSFKVVDGRQSIVGGNN